MIFIECDEAMFKKFKDESGEVIRKFVLKETDQQIAKEFKSNLLNDKQKKKLYEIAVEKITRKVFECLISDILAQIKKKKL